MCGVRSNTFRASQKRVCTFFRWLRGLARAQRSAQGSCVHKHTFFIFTHHAVLSHTNTCTTSTQPLPSGHDMINPLNRTWQKRPGSFADWPSSLHSRFPRPRAFVQQTKAAQASKERQAVHDRGESCGRVMLQLWSKRHQASTSRPRAKTRLTCASNWQR